MRDVSHTPPTGDRELNTVFSRGPRAMTDGGERTNGSRSTSEHGSGGGERERSERDPRREAEQTDGGERTDPDADHRDDGTARMRDVSHTPPAEDREVDRVFARGHERLASDEEGERDHERERVAGEVAEE